jgi:hypothetical protein
MLQAFAFAEAAEGEAPIEESRATPIQFASHEP